jgi:hypothetical protein
MLCRTLPESALDLVVTEAEKGKEMLWRG